MARIKIFNLKFAFFILTDEKNLNFKIPEHKNSQNPKIRHNFFKIIKSAIYCLFLTKLTSYNN